MGINMRENLQMAKKMVKESIPIIMEIPIKDTGQMIKRMEEELISTIVQRIIMMEIGKIM